MLRAFTECCVLLILVFFLRLTFMPERIGHVAEWEFTAEKIASVPLKVFWFPVFLSHERSFGQNVVAVFAIFLLTALFWAWSLRRIEIIIRTAFKRR